MATVTWVGKSLTRPQLDTITVGSHGTGETFVVTVNGKAVTYIALSSDTTNALVAAGLAAALEASAEPEFAEIAWAAASATVTATGPAGGTPFTATVSGTGTISTAATTAAAGPNDAGLGANYSGGALPSAADTLVFENSAVAVKFGLTALAAIGLTVIRRATYTGSIGLPDANPAGYPEYRTTHLSLKAAVATWAAGSRDTARQFRLNMVTTATAFTIAGDGRAAQPGNEAVELKGMVATSTINLSGGSVALCPLAGQTGVVGTFLATGGTFTVGPGLTLTTATVAASVGDLRAGFTTLTLDDGADVTVGEAAAAATGVVVNDGTVTWRSTATPGAVTIGSGGVFDLDSAPAAVTPGTITVSAGATLNDNHKRLAAGYTLVLDNCEVREASLNLGVGRSLVVS